MVQTTTTTSIVSPPSIPFNPKLPNSKVYQSLSDSLLNVSGTTPLSQRFRALFTLKSLGDSQSIHIIAQGNFFDHKTLTVNHPVLLVDLSMELYEEEGTERDRSINFLPSPFTFLFLNISFFLSFQLINPDNRFSLFAGFQDDSALLKHELAYVLGQIKSKEAIPILTLVLESMDQDPMVRHEVRFYSIPSPSFPLPSLFFFLLIQSSQKSPFVII